MSTLTQETKTVLTYLTGNVYGQQKLFKVPSFITFRSLVRRIKNEYGLQKYRHKAVQFTGADSSEYIRIDFPGLDIKLLIELDYYDYDDD